MCVCVCVCGGGGGGGGGGGARAAPNIIIIALHTMYNYMVHPLIHKFHRCQLMLLQLCPKGHPVFGLRKGP